MKKNESADHERPAPSPGSNRTRRERTFRASTPSAGLRSLLGLRVVPGRQNGRFALCAETALQLGRAFLRERLPPVEGVLRGRPDGPDREALRDGARVPDEAA